MAKGATYLIVAVAVLYFASVLLFFDLNRTEKGRVAAIGILFLASAMFWSGFEQAGSSLNLFAERHTERMISSLRFEIPTGWFQSLGPIFVISLAPVAAGLWVLLGKRNLNPSLPRKFAFGLFLLAGGFLVMAVASKQVATGQKVWPTWLILTYLLHTLGELCVSPVGLSSVSKLAPRRLVGQMMGLWFLATSLGNLVAGLIAGGFSPQATGDMGGRFFQIVLTSLAAGILVWFLVKPIQRMTAGVD
jgi:POT family proton-dependent oligopeptide transporter